MTLGPAFMAPTAILRELSFKEFSKMMKPVKASVANSALLCAAMLWGGGFVASKVALSGWPPPVVLCFRFGGSALLLGLLFGKRIRKTPKSTVRKGCTIGSLILVAFSIQLLGLQYTTSTKASFLCTSYVVLVPFISWIFLHRFPGVYAVLAGLLAFTGIGVISLNETCSIAFGDLLCLLYNLPYGLAIVCIGEFSNEDTDTIQMTFFQFLTISLLAGLLGLATGADFRCHSQEAVTSLFYLMLACTLIGMMLQNSAQRYTQPSTAAILISLESVFGFLFSVIYFQERVTARLLIGCSLCFAGIVLSHWKKKERIPS